LKQLFSRIPAGFGRLFGTAADWNFYTEKDEGCNGRKLYWPRGKMLYVPDLCCKSFEFVLLTFLATVADVPRSTL
jgi:hypothetical protein